MARIRTIKPEFWTDEKLVELSPIARLVFIGLWNFADDSGRMVYSVKRIKMQILPADDVDIRGVLGELIGAGRIRSYVVEGIEYLDIPQFLKHQKVDKPTPSKLPEFNSAFAEPSGSPRDGREGKGREGNGRDKTSPAVPKDITAREASQPENPEPDPATVATVETMRVSPGAGTEAASKAGELFAVLQANSCRGSPQHPQVVEWARQGITTATLRKAIAKARETTSDPLNPAYLAPIVERIAAGTDGRSNGAWKSDEQAALAKGLELGIKPSPGESWPDFRQRIATKLRDSTEATIR